MPPSSSKLKPSPSPSSARMEPMPARRAAAADYLLSVCHLPVPGVDAQAFLNAVQGSLSQSTIDSLDRLSDHLFGASQGEGEGGGGGGGGGGGVAAAVAAAVAGPAPPPSSSSPSTLPGCSCGGCVVAPAGYEMVGSTVMRIVLSSGLIVHVSGLPDLSAGAFTGAYRMTFEPVGFEGSFAKKDSLPATQHMVVDRTFIEHLVHNRTFAEWLEKGSGLFPPATVSASTSKSTAASSASTKAKAKPTSSTSSTSTSSTTTKTTTTSTKKAAGPTTSKKKEKTAATAASPAASTSTSESTAVSSSSPLLSSTAAANSQPKSRTPAVATALSTFPAVAATYMASPRAATSPTTPAAGTPAPSAPPMARTDSHKENSAGPSPSFAPSTATKVQRAAGRRAQVAASRALALIEQGNVANAKKAKAAQEASKPVQNAEIVQDDPCLDLDETVIASVSLAYEASDRGQLQTALKCIDIGRAWLGAADDRGKRSLQAWQDDSTMLSDAEAHIRARFMAKRTLRHLEDLLQVSWTDALKDSNLNSPSGDGDGSSSPSQQSKALRGLIKALTVLQDEVDGIQPAPSSDGESSNDASKVLAPTPAPAAAPTPASAAPAAQAQSSTEKVKEAAPAPAQKAAKPASSVPAAAAQQAQLAKKPIFKSGFLNAFSASNRTRSQTSSTSTSSKTSPSLATTAAAAPGLGAPTPAAKPPQETAASSTTAAANAATASKQAAMPASEPPTSPTASPTIAAAAPALSTKASKNPSSWVSELMQQLKLAPEEDGPEQADNPAKEHGKEDVPQIQETEEHEEQNAETDEEADFEEEIAAAAAAAAAAAVEKLRAQRNKKRLAQSVQKDVNKIQARPQAKVPPDQARLTPRLAAANSPSLISSGARIDDEDAFMDQSVPMRFTDADVPLHDTEDDGEEYEEEMDACKKLAQPAPRSGPTSSSHSPVMQSESPQSSKKALSKAKTAAIQSAKKVVPSETVETPPPALSELVSIAAPFKSVAIAVQKKLSARPSPDASGGKTNERASTMAWAIWLPPIEEDLQRVGIWSSTSVPPAWSSTIGTDGELGYVPDFVGEPGKLWFGEALSQGLFLARMSVRLPNAYGSPNYMETLLRGMDRSRRATLKWLALRGAPATFATPRVLDQFIADAKKLQSIQLFVLPEPEKKSVGPGLGPAGIGAGGAAHGGSGGGGGGGGATGGDSAQTMARLPSNLLSASTDLRRLSIVSPSYRTDFHFDPSSVTNLAKLVHLTLLLDEGSDIDVDWIKSVLRLCAGSLETLQLSGALTTGLSQPAGVEMGMEADADAAHGKMLEPSSSEDEDDDDSDEDEESDDSDDGWDGEGESSAQRHSRGHSSGHGHRRQQSSRSHQQHGQREASDSKMTRPMSKLTRLTLEDTASWGSAAQDLFESMHAPVLANLVLAGPRLDRQILAFGVTHLSLWPAPGANAHLPAHMSLSRPKQWVTRMLMHLDSLTHLELGVTQRAGVGTGGGGGGLSRGIDTNEIVMGVEQVVIDLEKEMLVLEAESGEAPPQPLGRPLLGTLRSLTIHHLPFDGVSLGRTVIARQRMAAATAAQDEAWAGPPASDDSDEDEDDDSDYGGGGYYDDDEGGGGGGYGYGYGRRFGTAARRSKVGRAVALESVRLVKCDKVTEAMRSLLRRHLVHFSTE
ncbi:hypothetical protein OC835_001010 [Tilletia horrida]|nr:hypothetical protein OC835_001010 [Tilletia horrida]